MINKIIFVLISVSLYWFSCQSERTQGFSFSNSQVIRIGAKHFNEGYLLAEIIAQYLENKNYEIERKFNLGGTLICFSALKNGEIDIYPEYTGTIAEQILHSESKLFWKQLHDTLLVEHLLDISKPYGFNNTYAISVRQTMANRLSLTTISDLQNYPDLKPAFSYEFLKRKDGWDNLARHYSLPHSAVGIEHGLAYQAISEKSIDIMDVYSTDGEIQRYQLKILSDDKNFFPVYEAVSFYRIDLPVSIKDILSNLTGKFDEEMMQALNASVVLDGKTHAEVAHSFLLDKKLIQATPDSRQSSFWSDMIAKTLTHLKLTFISLIAAMLIAIPLGIIVYWYGSLAKPVLYIVGLLQTIPSIALLAFMIPLFGIGVFPAIVALFLYALLPILRNTATALFSIDPQLKKVATGIGLTVNQRLRYIEFPLAIPNILAGIKTAAVINIGTATLAAFIGAGGLGEYIVTGLALNNTMMILQGAIPAALLAILLEFVFELIEKLLIPKHLQQKMVK
jgi:osmoprotectant transport system permease protein